VARAGDLAGRERELAELELDAMAALSVRLQRWARDADPDSPRARRRRRRRAADEPAQARET
jgi:hypothetical protein